MRLTIRRWLRPAASGWGPQSSLHASVRTELYGPRKQHKAIDGEFTIRDCAYSAGVDLHATKRKHALAHLRCLKRLSHDLDNVIRAYDSAIDELWGD